MSRDEAINAMIEGQKVTHRYFSDDEFICMPNPQTIITEEGYNFPFDDFMNDRQSEQFDKDWSIFKS